MARTQNIAHRDANDRQLGIGVSSVDLRTPVQLRVDPVTNYLLINSIVTSTNNASVRHRIDQNNTPTAYGVSSADGKTLIPIATDINGYLLVQFN